MTFRRGADLDTSQVEDLRGGGGRSYGGVAGQGAGGLGALLDQVVEGPVGTGWGRWRAG